jgi:hypothetical protein
MSQLAENIVQATLKELNGRKGFDDWWDYLDDETIDELTQALVDVVDQELNSSGF